MVGIWGILEVAGSRLGEALVSNLPNPREISKCPNNQNAPLKRPSALNYQP